MIGVYLSFFNQQTDGFGTSAAANNFQPTIITFHNHDVMDLPDRENTVGITPDFFRHVRDKTAVEIPDKQAGPCGVTDRGTVQYGNQDV